MTIDDQDVFRLLVDNSVIDLAQARQLVEMKKREVLLNKHPYRIWLGKKGYWYTYLPDPEKGRRQVKRKSEEELFTLICEYWEKEEDNPTIADVFREWLDYKLEIEDIKNPTYYRYTTDFERYYSDFGNRHIKGVSKAEFVDFITRIVPTYQLSYKAFRNFKIITKGIVRRAKACNYISWSYEEMLGEIEIPRRKFKTVKKDDSQEVFNVEESEKMIFYMTGAIDPVNAGLLLTFATGIRVGELASLKKGDLTKDVLHITKTETRLRVNGKYIYEVKDTPKTKAGLRDVVLPDEWEWLVTGIIELSKNNKEWLFEKNGERIKEKPFENRLRRNCSKLGMPCKSPHKIRKTYGTMLLDAGADQNFIKKQMGHVSLSLTEGAYHRDRKTLERKKSALSKTELSKFSKEAIMRNQNDAS